MDVLCSKTSVELAVELFSQETRRLAVSGSLNYTLQHCLECIMRVHRA